MKQQINEIRRMQQLAGLIKESINEITRKNVLPAVINVVKKAYKEGNTSDIDALEEMIGDELNIETSIGYVTEDPQTNGMGFILIGAPAATICVVDLVNKPKYQQALDSEEDSNYTKIGNWWVRAW